MRVPNAIAFAVLSLATPLAAQNVMAPAAVVADGMPSVPESLRAASLPYMEFRTASALGWNPKTRAMLIKTRFGNTGQIHEVTTPGAARTQLTFEAEPIGNARYAEGAGDVLLMSKDVGGDEFFQLYRYDGGRLVLLTDGKSRNTGGAWSRDGKLVGYSSTRRNGTDTDLYVMDPRDPKTDRMVAAVKGGGWAITDFAPDGKTALVAEYRSIQESVLYTLDLASGALTRITPQSRDKVSWGGAKYAPDGRIWVTSDLGGDFQRLGTLANGRFTPVAAQESWDVDEFDIAPDGSFIAYVVNAAGASQLKLLDPAAGKVTGEAKLPAGVAGGLDIAPWGAVAFTLSSAKSPADAYSLDPKTLAITRWTTSETGGLDASANVEPELVTVKSFDGLSVSGFLYVPDRAKFPGKRPLIVNIHGGPEGQSRPGFLGRSNYLLNEMGVAIFYPNVRGSTGYGKRFVSLDNGPFKREDSVKDIAAYLDALAKDDRLDPARVAVTGGSYGGYMCYASAIRYGDRLKGASCIVAISNFVTFLENTQGYRRDLRRVEYGDERDPTQRAKLLEISPMTRSKELRIPLFVQTGGNDPRVPASEADQMVAAVRGNGGMAWHMLAKNEGHGFAKKENADYQFWANLLFWDATLLKEAAAPPVVGKSGQSGG
jgi:dipeptidyl aminopeptidase/acylaminoacyl peptidase